MRNNYWLHGSSKEAISHLESVRTQWDSWNGNPIRQSWIRNYLAYYSPILGPTSTDTSLIFEGVQGELVRFFTPKVRSLIQQQVTLITKQRLAANCVAQTNGSDVVQDVKLGNSLLDQIIYNEKLDLKGRELCEGGLVAGGWFTETEWRTDKGQPYTRDSNGSIIYSGGVDVALKSVFDVFYDLSATTWEGLTSVETRSSMNRYDLIAQHPDLEQSILALPSVREDRNNPHTWFGGYNSADFDDNVYVYKCYAKPSPAIPLGRLIIYGAVDCVFYDDENMYGDIPVVPFFPDKVLGLNCGYPQLTNLMAAQEMYDNSLSAIATNQAQFAVQSILIARGSGINVQELDGMRFVSFTPQNVPGGGKPEPLQLTQSSPESFKFADALDRIMMDLSGIPSTLRGNPPPGVTSGVAIATLSANAIEFMNGVSMAYSKCWEQTLQNAVNCYKRFASVEQKVSITGKNNQITSRKFKGKDLESISGVKIQIVNPILQNTAGKLEVTQQLLSMPKEMWPAYTSVLEGRPFSEIYKTELSQADLINSENEVLGNGGDVKALATDDHGAHVREHAGLLNDPAVRLNGQANKKILDHILEHKSLAENTDPFLTAMVRTGVVPQQEAPPPGGGQPSPAGPPPGGPIEGDIAEPAAAPAEDLLNRGV